MKRRDNIRDTDTDINFNIKKKNNNSIIYFLTGICLSLVSLFTFLKIVNYYRSFGQFGIDSTISKFLTRMRGPLLTGFIKIVTSSGNFASILIISIIIILLLSRKGKRKEALFYSLSIIGIWLFNELLKSIFKRPRPVGAHLVDVTGYSFPSGHAMIFMGFSLLIVYYILENIKSMGMRMLLSTLMILYSVSVGLSRVYLGVHYFSDVIAGWMAAVLWVSVMIMIYKIIVLLHEKSSLNK